VFDVVAKAKVLILLNREVAFLSGGESCGGVYVTLEEDLMYRHDQESGEKWCRRPRHFGNPSRRSQDKLAKTLDRKARSTRPRA